MARIRRVKVKRTAGRRRLRAPGIRAAAPGNQALSATPARTAAPRAIPVLPIYRDSVKTTVAVIGRPGFRQWLCGLLAGTSGIEVLFNRDGPVTNGLSNDPGKPRVVMIDGDTAHQLALRAPTRDRAEVLANLPVLLVADAYDFEPPGEVGAVVGERWSVLLASNAENMQRLARSIERAAAGHRNIDPGIDKGLIRVVSDLNRVRRKID